MPFSDFFPYVNGFYTAFIHSFIHFYTLLCSVFFAFVFYSFFNVPAITLKFFCFLERSNFQTFFSRIIILSNKILYVLVGYPLSPELTTMIVHFNIYNFPSLYN